MTHLNPGDTAPDFKARDEKGEEIALSDYRGKKVILFFYPKDNTPGCTAEACNFRDHYEALTADGFEVIGVSTQDEKSHQKFIAKHDLPFHLIADEDRSVHEAYGTWGLKKFMGREFDGTHRTTFVIDEEGTIEHVIKKVKTKQATEQLRELMA